MGRPIDEALWDEWRQRLIRYEQWNGSIASFCAREGIAVASFYLWRRKLEPPGVRRGRTSSAAPEAPSANPLFLPVRIEQPEVVETKARHTTISWILAFVAGILDGLQPFFVLTSIGE